MIMCGVDAIFMVPTILKPVPSLLRMTFLAFCILAHRASVVPEGWDWAAFLKAAAEHIPFAFEKSDAKERWGSENVFQAQMGGRSLRYTGIQVYKSPVDSPNISREHDMAQNEVHQDKYAIQDVGGGREAWEEHSVDLGRCSRFR